MIKSAVTEMLGIEWPVFQGGMAWIADGRLAAAVSNAGGLGIIAAGNAPADYVQKQIETARSLTEKPFGVNIMLMSPYADDIAALVAREHVRVVTTGAGNPGKYMKMWKEAGVKVIPVVASVALAKRMERCGADAGSPDRGCNIPPCHRSRRHRRRKRRRGSLHARSTGSPDGHSLPEREGMHDQRCIP